MTEPCKRAEALPSYLLGELAPQEREELETHLTQCQSCQARLTSYEAVLGRLRGYEPARGGPDLAPRVQNRLLLPARSLSRRRVPPLAAGVAGFLLLVLLGAVAFQSPLSSPTPQVAPGPSLRAGKAFTREGEVLGRALDWLSSSQDPSGCWNPELWDGNESYRVGLTGLSLLAFLGAEEEPFLGPHADTIQGGLRYLLRRMGEDGRLGPPGQALVYNQALASLALLEASRLKKGSIPSRRLEATLRFLGTLQHETGGFGSDSFTSRPNAAASAWVVQVLVVGCGQGWEEGSPRMERALEWMVGLVDEKGRLGYREPGDHPFGSAALTAAGAFHLLSGKPAGFRDAQVASRMRSALLTDANRRSDEPDFCAWYFTTLALLATGGHEARTSNQRLQDRIAGLQVKGGPLAGSWHPTDQWSAAGGRVYSTAMAALSLEAHTRLPRLKTCVRDG